MEDLSEVQIAIWSIK